MVEFHAVLVLACLDVLLAIGLMALAAWLAALQREVNDLKQK